MTEIVAFIIDGVIYSGVMAIKAIQKTNRYDATIDRKVAEFMANCDLGQRWNDLAESPAIVIINEETKEIKFGPEYECLLRKTNEI